MEWPSWNSRADVKGYSASFRMTRARILHFVWKPLWKSEGKKKKKNVSTTPGQVAKSLRGLTLPLLQSEVSFLEGPLQGGFSHRLVPRIVEFRQKWVLNSICGRDAILRIERQQFFKEVDG